MKKYQIYPISFVFPLTWRMWSANIFSGDGIEQSRNGKVKCWKSPEYRAWICRLICVLHQMAFRRVCRNALKSASIVSIVHADDLFGTIPNTSNQHSFFPAIFPFSAYSMLCCMCAPTMFFFVRWLAVPPMVWIPQQLVGTPVGYNVTLECFIEAYPISLNYWSKDDSDMIHDSNKYKWVHFKWGLLFRPILDVYSMFKSIWSKVLWYCKLHDIYVSMFILGFFVEYFCITELKRLSIGHRISQQCV